jgi:hypothetical protein
MRLSPARNKSARIAALAASVALLAAACATGTGNKPGTNPTGNGAGGPGGVTLTPGTLLISDGTPNVRIGNATVTFPGPVTDAAFSPDGSRIAYIDGNGNVATAKPDGTDVLVLTETDPTVTRSRPSWSRAWIYYAEKKADTSTLMFVPSAGCVSTTFGMKATGTAWPMDTGDGTSYVDLAPSASTNLSPLHVVFQHNEPSGPQVWINDSNTRGGPTTQKIADGSEPALTLDATKLAYVGRDGYIHASIGSGANSYQVINVAGASHLVWNLDGSRLAYETPTDVEEIAVQAGVANPPTVLSNKPGVPSYLDGAPNTVNTLTGADAVALSVAVSRAAFRGWTGFEQLIAADAPLEAIITTTQATQAGNHYAPRLITAPDKLDDRVAQELKRLFGDISYQVPTLYLSADISAQVVSQLRGMGFTTIKPLTAGAAALPTGGVCGPQGKGDLLDQKVAVVDAADPIAVGLAGALTTTVIAVSGGALTPDQITFLQNSSGVLESAYAVGNVPADVVKQVGDLIAGPVSYSTASNPVLSGAVHF